MEVYQNATPIPIFNAISDPTGQIIMDGANAVQIQPGYYMISYHVSIQLRTPGYMQVTPAYAGAPHLEYSIYARTGTDRTTATGSASFMIELTNATTFTLTYNTNVAGIDGQMTMTILKLERPS